MSEIDDYYAGPSRAYGDGFFDFLSQFGKALVVLAVVAGLIAAGFAIF